MAASARHAKDARIKAGINGVLNCSVLDGWWDEGFNTDAGWAIGKGEIYEDEDLQDDVAGAHLCAARGDPARERDHEPRYRRPRLPLGEVQIEQAVHLANRDTAAHDRAYVIARIVE